MSIYITRNTSGSYVGKTVISSDHHTPFESKEKTENFKALIKEFKPDRNVLLGDVADTMLSSRFVENALIAAAQKIKMYTSVEEFQYMIQYVDSLAAVCPKSCEHHYIRGNHEYRNARALDKIRHLVGAFDPSLSAFEKSKFPWVTNYKNFPHGKFIVCDDPKNLIIAKHAGKGTGHNHAKATWQHTWASKASMIYGDTHKTMVFEGHSAPNPYIRDDRFAIGLGGLGDWENDSFEYAADETRAYWDGSVALITQHKSGKIEIVIEKV